MRKTLIMGCLVLSTSLSAQSFEEQYRAFQQQATKSYTDFRDEVNQKYADFMRGVWEYYNQAPAIPKPQEEKVPPVVYQDQEQKQDEQIPVEVLPAPVPAPAPKPVAPIEENIQPSTAITVAYLGTDFSFRIPKQKFKISKTDGESLAKLWTSLSSKDYDNLLFDCLHNRDAHQLCDWAYIELLGELSTQLYGPSNEATFLQGFLLSQSGYAMRLAQSRQGGLYVLVGSNYQIYERSYYELDGVYFYPIVEVKDGLQICQGKFDKEQPFSLYINPDQVVSLKESTSPERKSEQGIVATSTINLNTISFYNEYPTGQVGGDCGTRWATYANAPMEECVKQSLYPTLMQAIRGVPESQAVNKLLNWVQTAFEYEYDEVVWGHDRAFFPSETLHYPYADCEDRSILFSRIVRDLLHLDVVLIYYPGHLATAVNFHQDINGDYVLYNNRKFVVCDPTYIGAPIGMTMPGMDNLTAKLIPLQR